MPRLLVHLLVLVTAGMTTAGTGQATAALLYPTTGALSVVQNNLTITPLGDGNKLWVTQLTWTNTGPVGLANVYFVDDQAWLNNNHTTDAQWDNTTQQWISGSYVASASNPSLFVDLDPSITNISIPSGFGLATGDEVPAFLISSYLASGASVTTDVDFEITPNVSLFYFNGAAVGMPVPEPAALLLFSMGLVGLGLARRCSSPRGGRSGNAITP